MAEDKKPEAPAAAAPKPPPPPGPPAPPPPKNPGLVTAVVDGREVVVKPGTTVIEAAQGMGIDIPYYCWHKRLSVAANCRQCLVEMSNAPGGKLVPSCQVPLTEGVVVKTDTPRVKDQQRANLELLLLNHPVDCSICDQAGECKLQDYYMQFDAQPSRLDIPKNTKGKRIELGPTVTLDQERCILCTRCVRFMREVAKNPQLGVANRGTRSVITTFPGQPLDDRYAGNVVDLCPVGALTATDFRFRGRVWFMSSARSLCTGCARGCNVALDYLDTTAYRLRPRENADVNQEWMCDQGRTTYKALNAGRVLAARLGRGAAAARATRDEALKAAGLALAEARRAGGVAVLLSPVASLEDLLAACHVAKEGLGAAEVFVGGRPDGWQDDFLKKADENPNRKGLELAAQAYGLAVRPFADLVAAARAGRVGALWVVGAEVPDAAGAEALAALPVLVVQAVNEGPLAAAATALLPASPHAEGDGTFVNFEGRAQRFEAAWHPRGEARPHLALAGALGRALGLKVPWGTARETWLALSPRLAGVALWDFKWDSLPSVGRRKGHLPLAAGTVDGRLAGQKERLPPEGSEPAKRGVAPTSW
ncbi:MAG: (2Fe-2S)-binding protein [Anaeromyxobacter sp.]|nr:(2Fe-2S)-binding protein [Anaeromyxobacter sp.]MBL0276809.1 (2Fe-2S)-binding protein [Anaeromyxobacter sp.]